MVERSEKKKKKKSAQRRQIANFKAQSILESLLITDYSEPLRNLPTFACMRPPHLDSKMGGQKRGRAEAEAEPAANVDSERPRFSKVDQETSSYFAEISNHFKALEDDEEKQLVADNALGEAAGTEARVASDAACSRVLEALLPHASIPALATFMGALCEGENLGATCTRWDMPSTCRRCGFGEAQQLVWHNELMSKHVFHCSIGVHTAAALLLRTEIGPQQHAALHPPLQLDADGPCTDAAAPLLCAAGLSARTCWRRRSKCLASGPPEQTRKGTPQLSR